MSHQKIPKQLFAYFHFSSGNFTVLPTMQHAQFSKNLKLIGHCTMTAMSASNRVHRHSSRHQWPNDPFLFEIFLSPPYLPCRLWCFLMHESKFYWIICSFRWYVRQRWSVEMFIFSSIGGGREYEEWITVHLHDLRGEVLHNCLLFTSVIVLGLWVNQKTNFHFMHLPYTVLFNWNLNSSFMYCKRESMK